MDNQEKLEQSRSRENMITSVDSVASPPQPQARACEGGCGEFIAPVFVEPIISFGRVMGFSNIWKFENHKCSSCTKKATAERLLREQEILDKAREAEKKMRQEVLMRMIGKKGYAEFKFENFSGESSAKEACEAFDPATANLYLWGPAGTGKTHLAVATMRETHNVGLLSIFIKHAGLNRSLQGLRSKEYEEQLNYFLCGRVLVVDDLGTGKQTDFADQVLYEIIDGRIMDYQHGMIITSNLSLSDLAIKLGDDRLTSRIAGNFKIVKCEGRDYRLNKKC